MEIMAFKAEHLNEILLKDPQPGLNPAQAEYIERTQPYSWTVKHEDKVLGCGGVVHRSETRGEAWAVIDRQARKHFMTLTRIALSILGSSSLTRIEATASADRKENWHWLQLLGFEFEGIMKKYNPNGSDAALYARIK